MAQTAPGQDPLLDEMVQRLVRTYHPLKVYLFGSRARGDHGPHSDYDLLLVVADDSPTPLRGSRPAYEALWGLGQSGDILVWTDSAFQERLHLKASLPAVVAREGKLLHAA